MSEPRRPAAFRIEPDPGAASGSAEPEAGGHPDAARKPRAVARSKVAVVTPAEIDAFDGEDEIAREPPLPVAPRRRSLLATIFFTSFGALVSLAVGLWTDRLIRDLFERSDWLGWAASAAAGIAVLSLVVILTREFAALVRLGSVEKIRSRAADAIARDDPKSARGVVDALSSFVAARPETAAGRRMLADLRGEIIDGADLVRLAETEILAPLDLRARTLILDAAKRVSVVTAVSPRAVVDLAYVLFEAGRLIRRLAELYGGRPGTLGFIRLIRDVVVHLAVTGSLAAGDSVVQQLIGHGLAARLSAKLGEGIVNGMMTARIGIAAMEAVRPLPFTAVKRPGIGDFLAALSTFAKTRTGTGDAAEK